MSLIAIYHFTLGYEKFKNHHFSITLRLQFYSGIDLSMLNKMASLIMSVNDSVINYIKKAKDKDIAGKIGSEVLVMVKDIVKKHMFDPPNALTYWSIKPIKILSREMIRVNKLVVRRMKPSPVGKTPWKISLSRYMPTDIFDLFDNYGRKHLSREPSR